MSVTQIAIIPVEGTQTPSPIKPHQNVRPRIARGTGRKGCLRQCGRSAAPSGLQWWRGHPIGSDRSRPAKDIRNGRCHSDIRAPSLCQHVGSGRRSAQTGISASQFRWLWGERPRRRPQTSARRMRTHPRGCTAEPTCVTGSIGVIASVITMEGLAEKIGVEANSVVATRSPEKAVANDL